MGGGVALPAKKISDLNYLTSKFLVHPLGKEKFLTSIREVVEDSPDRTQLPVSSRFKRPRGHHSNRDFAND
jgi:hypothetical protein